MDAAVGVAGGVPPGDVLPDEVLPDEVAAWAACAPVQALLRPLLVGLDIETLSRDGKLDLAAGLDRLGAHVAAVQARTLASLAGEPEQVPGAEFVLEEIAAALRWSPNTAAARVHEAELLVDRLPGTLALLGTGEISPGHARAVCDTVRRTALDPALTSPLEARVLPRAAARTAAELRRDLRRAIAALDPRDAAEKHQDAVAQRRVSYQPDEDGMAWLNAYLPVPDAQTVWLALQALADRGAGVCSAGQRNADCGAGQRNADCGAGQRNAACGAGKCCADDRSADQRRADALTTLASTALAGAELPRWQGRRPTIQVTVALSTLLGLDEQSAELDGHGPIPAPLARRLAADPTGTWHRLITDPAGRLLDYARTRYRPPRPLTEYVLARDRTCRHPGCHRTARRAELDHIHDWAHGGTTNAPNLHTLCHRHHRTKHDAGWHPERTPDGTTHWTSPTGRRYTKPPEPLFLDTTRTKPPERPPTDTTRTKPPDDPPF